MHQPKARRTAGATAAALFLFSGLSQADEGPWQVGIRGVYTDFANRSDAISILGVPADAIRTDDSWRAEFDAEYFIVTHVSAELAISYPQTQTLRFTQTAAGSQAAGSFKDLPLTLTVKYGFMPGGPVRPYVGAGIQWTHFSSVDLSIPNGPIELSKWSIGAALQGGADVVVTSHWVANLDLKWARAASDVDLCCVKVSEMHFDPFTVGLGVAYRFGGAR